MSNPTQKISACLIVKNEEAMIEECLDSLKGFDEIVVCDTGSTDKTQSICLARNVRLFEDYKWQDNFAEARNHAKSKCTGDWILSIDADEILDLGGLEKIRATIATTQTQTLDVKIHSNKTSFFFPRLFRNIPEVKWCGAVHNYLNIAEQCRTDISITYRHSPSHQSDPNRALRILAKEVNKNPELQREKFYLAREYFYRKQWPSAIYWFNRYLERESWGPERAHARVLLAKCYIFTLEPLKARLELLQALSMNANYKEALELLANLSGPGNKKRWLEFATTATNEDVLFKQSD